MDATILKWKCGCGKKFRTKKECKKHISKEHWHMISNTGGIAGFFFRPERIEVN